MLQTLLFALIPIIVTIGIGYFAAYRNDFDDHDSQQFVKLVMNYALPFSVFAGIWGTPRKIIIADIPLAGWLLVGMVGCYIVLIIAYRFGFRLPLDLSSLRALSVADPSAFVRRLSTFYYYQLFLLPLQKREKSHPWVSG